MNISGHGLIGITENRNQPKTKKGTGSSIYVAK